MYMSVYDTPQMLKANTGTTSLVILITYQPPMILEVLVSRYLCLLVSMTHEEFPATLLHILSYSRLSQAGIKEGGGGGGGTLEGSSSAINSSILEPPTSEATPTSPILSSPPGRRGGVSQVMLDHQILYSTLWPLMDPGGVSRGSGPPPF